MKTVLNVKIDREVKIRAQKTAAELGLPLSLVVTENLKRFTNERTITFAAPLKPSKKLAKWIKGAERDLKTGRNLSPVFSTSEEMDRYLDAL